MTHRRPPQPAGSPAVLEPGQAGYDAARVVWNGMIDRRPALIARCRNAADVSAAVNYARSRPGLTVAIHSGGHNVAGYAVCDGGLMIDLSLMNGVRVDPDLKRAHVEGGATWGDVDRATAPFGRATPGGLISATGVAGLSLSGGIGWLRGTRGPQLRQHRGGGRGARRRSPGAGQRDRESRSALGPERRRRKLRRGGELHLPHPSHRAGDDVLRAALPRERGQTTSCPSGATTWPRPPTR